MRLTHVLKEDTYITVAATVSRRNLLALLTRIYSPERATLTVNEITHHRPSHVSITAETDEAHYGDRKPGPISIHVEQALQIAVDLLNQIEDGLTEDGDGYVKNALDKTANQIGYIATQLAGRSVQIV